MEHIRISPIKELVYPNRGGYTGFSVCIWETDHRIPGSYCLMSPWGGAEGSSELKASQYVLEGRFFVFGSLLDRVFINRNSLQAIEQIFEKLLHGWTPLMDEVTKREHDLSLKKIKDGGGRSWGIYIDEIVNNEFRNLVQGQVCLTQRAPGRLSADGGRGVFDNFVEFSKKILAKIGGR